VTRFHAQNEMHAAPSPGPGTTCGTTLFGSEMDQIPDDFSALIREKVLPAAPVTDKRQRWTS
jgi:hypothetical protein